MTILELAKLIEDQQIDRLKKENLGCDANILNVRTKVIKGRKYTKINIGGSGRYMVDKEGIIYGIKGYGQVNIKNTFGTLDTAGHYYWGQYYAIENKHK